MLSQWYGNPNLSPAEADRVETLLSQLAGTVVYSTESRLEPPYTVRAGDTLQTIAQQYQVPWQLLAKINGIPAANLVQPGQQLKVIHGPFAAIVELQKSQLTLELGGRYAGRFPITAEPTAAQSEGEWVLEQKLVNPTTAATGIVNTSYDATAPVDRVLVLRSESPTAAATAISITGGTGLADRPDGGRAGRVSSVTDRRRRGGRHPVGRLAGDDSQMRIVRVSVVRCQLHSDSIQRTTDN